MSDNKGSHFDDSTCEITREIVKMCFCRILAMIFLESVKILD